MHGLIAYMKDGLPFARDFIVGTPPPPSPLLKGGDQLSKIGNLGGGDKITLSKKGGQMKKGRLVYTRGVSVFLLVFSR